MVKPEHTTEPLIKNVTEFLRILIKQLIHSIASFGIFVVVSRRISCEKDNKAITDRVCVNMELQPRM